MTDTRVVPVEPTEKMLQAAEREWDGRMSARSAGVWQAMIEAAPTSELAALEKQAAVEWSVQYIESEAVFTPDCQWFYLPPESPKGFKNHWNRACTILEANNMLERHETNAEWVRIREPAD